MGGGVGDSGGREWLEKPSAFSSLLSLFSLFIYNNNTQTLPVAARNGQPTEREREREREPHNQACVRRPLGGARLGREDPQVSHFIDNRKTFLLLLLLQANY